MSAAFFFLTISKIPWFDKIIKMSQRFWPREWVNHVNYEIIAWFVKLCISLKEIHIEFFKIV